MMIVAVARSDFVVFRRRMPFGEFDRFLMVHSKRRWLRGRPGPRPGVCATAYKGGAGA